MKRKKSAKSADPIPGVPAQDGRATGDRPPTQARNRPGSHYLSRMNRNQKGKPSPSAVRANLDYPPIHIRPIFPASAGAKRKNPMGSGHYGTTTIAQRLVNRNGFLCRKRQESGGKGLTIPPFFDWADFPAPEI